MHIENRKAIASQKTRYKAGQAKQGKYTRQGKKPCKREKSLVKRLHDSKAIMAS
jgi:hypothetical protein